MACSAAGRSVHSAHDIGSATQLLCFDEFQVTDVADFENPGNNFYQVNVMMSCSADERHGLIYAFEPMTSSTPCAGA